MIQDLTHAVRALFRRPLVTAVAVLSLALGIGVNSAIFSVFDRLLLRRIPVPEPERIVNVVSPGPRPGSTSTGDAGRQEAVFSHPLFRQLERIGASGITLAAHRDFPVNLAHDGRTEEAEGILVSGRYFELLRLDPTFGRLLGREDDQGGSEPVAVLAHHYWTSRFGADPGVLGRTLVANGNALTVVGVGPADFAGTTTLDRPDIFVPLALANSVARGGLEAVGDHWLYLFGRLGPGAEPAQVEEALNVPFSTWLRDVELPILPATAGEPTRAQFLERRISLVDGSHGRDSDWGEIRSVLTLLFAVTGFVLAIACVNVANLLLTRAADRSREIAIRLSLGASRLRLVRLGLAEAAVLGLLGGAGALLVGRATLGGLMALLPPADGRMLGFEINGHVLLFSMALGLGTSVLFGTFPAVHGVRAALAAGLQTRAGHTAGTRAATRVRTTLATGQIALATALLGVAGLFVVSLIGLSRAELGLIPDGVITFRLSPSLNGYTPERALALFEQMEEALRATPGVTSVSSATIPVLANSNWTNHVRVEGFDAGPDADTAVAVSQTGTDYFRTLGMPLVAGRDFTRADRPDAPRVAIVNEAFARRFALGAGAVGTRVAMGREEGPLDIEIVGLVRDARYSSVREPAPPQIFLAYRQPGGTPTGSLHFYARSTSGTAALSRAVPALVAGLDASLPVSNLRTLENQIWENTTADRVFTTLSSWFAGLALVLAAIGLYAVIAYGVAQRLRELGIRIALGAQRWQVRWLVLSRVVRMGLVGGAIGFGLALAFGRLGRALLFGVGGYEAAIAGVAALVVLTVAVGAGVLPARRAALVDPAVTLRAE